MASKLRLNKTNTLFALQQINNTSTLKTLILTKYGSLNFNFNMMSTL